MPAKTGRWAKSVTGRTNTTKKRTLGTRKKSTTALAKNRRTRKAV